MKISHANIGVSSLRIADTPIAIIDFETTGLDPGYDRVVEVSVVRIDPGEKPRLVFDTLVNPLRSMAATEVHGIKKADVAKAPCFQDIAGELLAATQGCVIAAYNVYFDMRFLNFELANVGVYHEPPHFCLMYMRNMLGIGPCCRLAEACRLDGIDFSGSHVAANDALASGLLFANYLAEIKRQGVLTYGDLARLKKYKFTKSFSSMPFPDPAKLGLNRFSGVVSRAGFKPSNVPFG